MPFLLYVGDRNHYKNADRLLQAYSVWKHRKKVALVVVGGQWKADEERRLTDLGIQDYVRLFTGINDEELCKLYNQAIAFVYPSLYEGFGIPLLEAMACGCPIVASRIPSTVEVAGDCPIYFEPAEIDDLLNAFDIALSEGRESARVKAGLEKVTSYSWDKTAAQTLEVYQAFES
ncbi:MAG: glycosyltransferase family 4 protein, partial [Desulfobacteraceae bacterium]|nr:glycosyltransferase family 4 protein [Desulfobacteraceae bacterium]